MRRRPPDPERDGVLIVVQNLPVPFDRRVWNECRALRAAGIPVAVVCPKAPGDPGHTVLEGVHLYKYRPCPPTQRKAGFLVEYLYSFTITALLAARAWRRHRFAVLQACNPPDVFWPLAHALRWCCGTRFVYDQHDLCPELYLSRFPDGPRLFHRGLLFLERRTYRAADHVVATNASYRRLAIERGGKRPDQVTIVRSGPEPARLTRTPPDPALRRGRSFLVCYLGVMGPQDGVDLALRAVDIVVHRFGRDDISFTFIGSGDCFDDLRRQARELDLEPYVEFTGRAPDELVFRLLSTADLGLSPDPRNPLNDVSTMNKTMEYMTFSLPVVAFDLQETRVSAEAAAVYVEADDVERYAKAIVELLDDEPTRLAMGRQGRRRIEDTLAWHHQSARYVELYRRLLPPGA